LEVAREGVTAAEMAARMTVDAPPARIADGVCDNTGGGRAPSEKAAITVRAYGFV
jgi:hypothetical protein